jgi:hypothetical protein
MSPNHSGAARDVHGWPDSSENVAMKTWHPEARSILTAAALLASAGCGVHYWQRPGADVQDFQQDSRNCVTEAKVPRLGIEPEQMYRVCMRARGWQRVQAGVPERNQFRGPEEVSDFDDPPSPTEGQGAIHSDATTEIACRGPKVSRSAGMVCHPR